MRKAVIKFWKIALGNMCKKKLFWQIFTTILKEKRKYKLCWQMLCASLIKVMYETYNIVAD